MQNLQSLNDLVAKFQEASEYIASLEAKNETLRQDCVTLTAKKNHLLGRINEINDSVNAANETQNQAKQDSADELLSIEQAKAQAQTELDKVMADRKTMQQQAIAKKTELERESETLSEDIAQKHTEINKLLDDKADLIAAYTEMEEELEQIKQIIFDKKAEESNQQQLAQTRLDSITKLTEQAEAALSVLEVGKQTAQSELDDKLDAIKQADIELKERESKHKQFLDYEERAKKVLEAKDASLTERELQLEKNIGRSKRPGVLDNLS